MRVFVVLVAAALFAMPAWSAGQTLDATVYELGNASTPIAENVGSRFLIELASNKTTGYSWAAGITGRSVTSEGSAYQASEGHAMGAPGQQIFLFDASRKGTSTVTFSYRRPWEHGQSAAKTITFTIVVK